MTSAVDLDALADLALEVATAAGQLLRDRPATLTVGSKSTPTDVVTDMDRAAEALIVDRLTTARPGDGILGEEGADRPSSTGVRWIIDPLDGTVNYLYGIPAWAVCVAAEVAGTVEVGVVCAPMLGETYVARRGRGAQCRSVSGTRDLLMSEPPVLSEALVGTGFGYDSRRRARQAAVLAEVLPAVRDIRRVGAASIDLAFVAAGRLDAYYERGLQPWDHAAAGLVAREAGARVEGLHGGAPDHEVVIAARDPLFTVLHDLLEPLGVDRD